VCNTDDTKCNADTKIQPIVYTFNIIGEHHQSAVIQTSSMTGAILMIKKGRGFEFLPDARSNFSFVKGAECGWIFLMKGRMTFLISGSAVQYPAYTCGLQRDQTSLSGYKRKRRTNRSNNNKRWGRVNNNSLLLVCLRGSSQYRINYCSLCTIIKNYELI
jgi:hypothetical protein